MRTIKPDELIELAARLLESAGARAEDALFVAKHCVDANLAGHDSHGVVRIPEYISRIETGDINCEAEIRVTDETPTTAMVDGDGAFGQVVMRQAMDIALRKADAMNVAAITIVNQAHAGRLAAYSLMAAQQGFIGIVFANGGNAPKMVAPYGGAEARLHTNPISFAVPSHLETPLHFDLATSGSGWGKALVAASKGERLEVGQILDREGRATTDPAALRNGGVLLPFGERDAFKAYSLAVMVEVICSILSGNGYSFSSNNNQPRDCAFMLAIKVSAFQPLSAFSDSVTAFAGALKSTRPSEGFPEVLYPGERSGRTRLRRSTGLAIDPPTWDKLKALSMKYGLSSSLRNPKTR